MQREGLFEDWKMLVKGLRYWGRGGSPFRDLDIVLVLPCRGCWWLLWLLLASVRVIKLRIVKKRLGS